MYVCVHECVCLCLHVCRPLCVCVCVCVYVCVRARVRVRVRARVRIRLPTARGDARHSLKILHSFAQRLGGCSHLLGAAKYMYQGQRVV